MRSFQESKRSENNNYKHGKCITNDIENRFTEPQLSLEVFKSVKSSALGVEMSFRAASSMSSLLPSVDDGFFQVSIKRTN